MNSRLTTFAFLIILVPFFVLCRPNGKKTVAAVSSLSTSPLSDSALLDLVEKQTFQYFWDGAEPTSGMGRERFHVDGDYPDKDKNIVATGGSGFGIMAIIAAIDRHYITREEGVRRLNRVVSFLETADRFHGAWPHWLNGETGKVKPFGTKDDGGDLVETSYLMEGMLCARQYFKAGNTSEQQLSAKIDSLWRGIDFNWYRNGKNVLYWHWSPDYQWQMNFPVTGYNECMIMYVLAASSPAHTIPAQVYHEGWARSGKIAGGSTQYGYRLALNHNGARQYGGPLFWAHYSYVGLDPRGLRDRYADYWEENKNQALINYTWCVKNPQQYKGYAPDNWGLTASYSVKGYAAHAPGPESDLGVISPTAALSSFPYTPAYSMQAMRHWYNDMRNRLWGPYGFYDAFSETDDWYPQRYLAIDQGPIVAMMENYRSGLLWKLFMSCPEVKAGLTKLGFESPHLRE
ncbi:MAG TPA: glucoamylase family protein [Chitinophagaceae bacterium]